MDAKMIGTLKEGDELKMKAASWEGWRAYFLRTEEVRGKVYLVVKGVGEYKRLKKPAAEGVWRVRPTSVVGVAKKPTKATKTTKAAKVTAAVEPASVS